METGERLVCCAVKGCNNSLKDGFAMMNMPDDEAMRSNWFSNMGVSEALPKEAVICETHFASDMFENGINLPQLLKKSALPTLFSFNGDILPTVSYRNAIKCSAHDCYNREGYCSKSVSFHRFSTVSESMKIMLTAATGNPNVVPHADSYFCSEHFEHFHPNDASKSSKNELIPVLEQRPLEDIFIEIQKPSSSLMDNDVNQSIVEMCQSIDKTVCSEGMLRTFVVRKKDEKDYSESVIVKLSSRDTKERILKTLEVFFEACSPNIANIKLLEPSSSMVKLISAAENTKTTKSKEHTKSSFSKEAEMSDGESNSSGSNSAEFFRKFLKTDHGKKNNNEIVPETIQEETDCQDKSEKEDNLPLLMRLTPTNSHNKDKISNPNTKRKLIKRKVKAVKSVTSNQQILKTKRTVKTPMKYKEFKVDCLSSRSNTDSAPAQILRGRTVETSKRKRKIDDTKLKLEDKADRITYTKGTVIDKRKSSKLDQNSSSLKSGKKRNQTESGESKTKKGRSAVINDLKSSSSEEAVRSVPDVNYKSAHRITYAKGTVIDKKNSSKLKKNIISLNSDKKHNQTDNDESRTKRSQPVVNKVLKKSSTSEEADSEPDVNLKKESENNGLIGDNKPKLKKGKCINNDPKCSSSSRKNQPIAQTILHAASLKVNANTINGVSTSVLSNLSDANSLNDLNNLKIISTLAQLVEHLREKQLLDLSAEKFLIHNFSHFELQLILKAKMKNSVTQPLKFSSLQIDFALCIYIYSMASFRYLSSVFSLPPIWDLSNALVSENFSPGILKQTLDMLDGGDKGWFIMVDSVPLRKGTVWDEMRDMYVGYTELFPGYEYDTSLATSVILIMLCRLEKTESSEDLPLAYFPVNRVNSEFVRTVVELSVYLLFRKGINPEFLVLDASDESFEITSQLGSCVGNPVKGPLGINYKVLSKLPIIIDPHHLAQRTRDTLSALDLMSSREGWIEWKFIKLLDEVMTKEFKTPINLLPLTLSNLKLDSTLAMAIDSQKSSEFSSSKPTVHFIKKLDLVLSLFDYNKPLFKSTTASEFGIKIQFLLNSDFLPYLRNLGINSKSIFFNTKYPFMLGYFFSVNSICRIYNLIVTGKLSLKRDIRKNRFTLDPLELFYHTLFKTDNSINVPNCLEFKKGLIKYFNWINNKEIPLMEVPPLLTNFRSVKRSHKTSFLDSTKEQKKFEFLMGFLNRRDMTVYRKEILRLISKSLVNDIIRQISCWKCIDMLKDDGKESFVADHNYITDDWKKKLSKIYSVKECSASADVLKIIQICDKVFEKARLVNNIYIEGKENFCNGIVVETKSNLYEGQIMAPFYRWQHPVFEDTFYTTHELYLTGLIINKYIRTRYNLLTLFTSNLFS